MINSSRFRMSTEINRQGQLSREIARLQTEVSTGKRIQAPSDDPTAAARVSELGRTQANEKAYSRNLATAAALAQRADATMAGVTVSVDRARELMLAGASGTSSAEDRRIFAAELRGLATQIAALATATDSRGVALFSAGDPLQIPVAAGISVVAVGSRAEVFETVTTLNGPKSYVDILNDAADALEIPEIVPRQTATDEALGELEAAVGHIANVAGIQGVRAGRIDTMQDRALDSALEIQEERTGLEGADLTETIARLQSKQLTLEAAQAVFARINQTGLFDLLR